MRRTLPRALALSLLLPTAAFAAAPRPIVNGSVPARSIVTEVQPDRTKGPWKAFESKYGRWEAQWNQVTASPHRAYGKGIALAGFRDDATSAESAVRGFVSAEPELFGTPELEMVKTTRINDRWYVRFRQRVDGMPVRFADWEFRVGANGRMSAFGADAIRQATVEDAAAPTIAAGVARASATLGIAFDASRDQVTGGDQVSLLPVRTETGLVLRRVVEVNVDVATMPPSKWFVLVDAVTGEVRMRIDRVRFNVTGQVTGGIHPFDPFSALSVQPLKSQQVTIGATSVNTDASGNYDANVAGTQTLTARFQGPFCNVNRQDAADAAFSVSVTNPQVQNVAWTGANSQDSERDAFYHTGFAHDYAKTIDPAFTGVDYQMPVAVNIASTCNAYWDGTGINFYLAGGGCPNTATMASVVYHEYGHGVNDQLYAVQGVGFMSNGALHEGTADVNSNMIEDFPQTGRGFGGPGTFLRTSDNTNHWPEDDGEAHFAGLMIAGAFWDLREAIGLATTRHLAHFAKYGVPDDGDNGVAMHEFFVETLVADDDDADLSNGTPNGVAIATAFNAHGIGTGFFIDIAHTALTDTPSHGPYLVSSTITYTGPFGALDTSSPTLHYSVNGAPFQTVAMEASGSPNGYRATLPGVFVGLVRYYITAADNLGGEFAYPLAAPTRGVISFLAGPVTTAFSQDMETNPGWTVGGPQDSAPTGVWLRANPVAAYVGSDVSQPEDDHTAGAGVNCWITGNAAVGAAAGTNDVDGGQTTLTTNVFSALGLNSPLLDFYRWYRNDLGSTPATDTFHVEISNNGGASWVTLADVHESAGAWTRSVYRIEDVITPTANMRVRFRASDFGDGSLVEAGIDDFRLIGVSSSVDVATSAPGVQLQIAAAPNPFASTAAIRWTLPQDAEVTLAIYDAAGRRVRTMAHGQLTAGSHSLMWDGRNDRGTPVGAGLYWMRLQAGSQEVKSSVVRLR